MAPILRLSVGRHAVPHTLDGTFRNIDHGIPEDARAYGLNVSLISEQALAAAVRAETARRWETDNAEVIA
jgi:Post-segregation antitoxin CcdA